MTKRKTTTSRPAARTRAPHPRSVAVPDLETQVDDAPEQPFEKGAHDAIGPELRHRMISEAAFYRYAQRGYTDGYDVDDWAAAEAEIDHLLVNQEFDEEPGDAAERG